MSITLPPPPREKNSPEQEGQWRELLWRIVKELREELDEAVSDLTAHQARFTDWVSFTPTGVWTTNATYTGKWRRVGDSMDVEIRVATAGLPDTALAQTVNIPSGYLIDTEKLTSTGLDQNLGLGVALDAGNAAYPLLIRYSSTSAVSPQTLGAAGTYVNQPGALDRSSPFTFGAGDSFILHFTVPIVGWGA